MQKIDGNVVRRYYATFQNQFNLFIVNAPVFN